MRSKIFFPIIFIVLLYLAHSSINVVQAAQGDNNGKPFQELNAEIQTNRALIEQNRAAIDQLQLDVSELKDAVHSIDSRLTGLTEQVAANAHSLEDAFALIATAQGDIQALYNEMLRLAARHEEDISNIHMALAEIRSDLSSLSAQTTQLAADLEQKITELRSLISDNTIAIDGLLTDIILINAELSSLNGQYNALLSAQSTLTDQLNHYSSRLDGFYAEMEGLKARIAQLEGFHYDPCIESISIGQTVPVTLTDECESAHRSGAFARYFTFTIADLHTLTVDFSHPTPAYPYDPYLFLLSGAGRNGDVIAVNDDYLSRNSHISLALPAGTYTIETTTYYLNITGPGYTLSLQ